MEVSRTIGHNVPQKEPASGGGKADGYQIFFFTNSAEERLKHRNGCRPRVGEKCSDKLRGG